MIIALLTVGTMGLSNTSLGYLNYPTQVIFKCCKLIPVMIGGIFIQGEETSQHELWSGWLENTTLYSSAGREVWPLQVGVFMLEWRRGFDCFAGMCAQVWSYS